MKIILPLCQLAVKSKLSIAAFGHVRTAHLHYEMLKMSIVSISLDDVERVFVLCIYLSMVSIYRIRD